VAASIASGAANVNRPHEGRSHDVQRHVQGLVVDSRIERSQALREALGRILDTVADIGLDIPVFLVAPAENLAREQEGLMADVVRGLIYPEEDAPDFVARYINRHFEAYIEQLKTPFFGRIVEFNESSSEMWTCPGHNGGMFYRRSPVGRVFYEYLGETVFRTDRRDRPDVAEDARYAWSSDSWLLYRGATSGSTSKIIVRTDRSLAAANRSASSVTRI
jgi:Orn/Lys/Arg decarboxylase, major domain